MQVYYIISGEGEVGTWKRVETASIAESLRDERCGGDRWARAIKDIYATEDGFAGYDVETGEVRSVPSEIVVESNTESSSVTLELTDEDATELYYAFRNRGHSSTRVKVAEFLKASDKRNGRDSRDCDWYNGDLESD